MTKEYKIKLKNVRLSYPSLFKKKQWANVNESDTKYEATFILDKDSNKKDIKLVKDAIAEICKDNKIKIDSIDRSKLFFKDGDLENKPELINAYRIIAKTKNRPITVDASKDVVTEDDNIFYAGCYVNVIISLWTFNNQFGKGVSANLLGCQFKSDGESFTSNNTSLDDFEVEDFEIDEDEDDDISF